MPRLLLLAVLVCLASGASAQPLNLFTACSEGEATRVCGYRTTSSGAPTVFTPPTGASLNYMAVASGQLATLINVFEDGQFVGADLILSDIDGSSAEASRIPAEFVPTQRFSLSPDLTRIAYVGTVANSTGLRIYDFEADTTGVLLASGVSSFTDAPAWSPDGERLLVTLRGDNPGFPSEAQPLAIVSADGSGILQTLTTPGPGAWDTNASWSSNGTNIAFIRQRPLNGGAMNIEFVSAGGSRLTGNARPVVPKTGTRLLTDVEWVGNNVAVLSVTGGVQVEISIGVGESAVVISSVNPNMPNTVASFRLLNGLSSRGLVVNVTGDGSDIDLNDGLCDANLAEAGEQCTLRAAIANANLRTERDSISFDIPGTAPHVINVPRSLPTSNHPLAIDAMTQPGYTDAPLVQLAGAGTATGLVFAGGDSAVRGLSIGGFAGPGVKIQGAGGSRVEANWIGIAPDGTTAIANGTGIAITGSPDNVIGSPEAARFNLIGNNTGIGIDIGGASATGNRVIRNVIGMAQSGTDLAANTAAAIRIYAGAKNTRVGTATDGNRIAGTRGIEIGDFMAEGGAPDDTFVRGNVLGLTRAGTAALGEMEVGIAAAGGETGGASGLKIGGFNSGEGNTVVASVGIWVDGRRSSGAIVGQNRVGLTTEGERARTDTLSVGILITSANLTQLRSNVVGGFNRGVVVASNENMLEGNLIGLDPTGEKARPNTRGLWIPSSYVSSAGTLGAGDGNMIGSQARPNVISGNSNAGVFIGGRLTLGGNGLVSGDTGLGRTTLLVSEAKDSGTEHVWRRAGSSNNTVAFNRIGTNSAGTRQIGNGRQDTFDPHRPGIHVAFGSENKVLGNLVSGNGAGIQVEAAVGNVVERTIVGGNVVGGSVVAGATIPNQYGGIEVENALNTRIDARPLVEGGQPVPNQILSNGVVGLRIVSGDLTRIRQNVFEGNENKAIQHFSGNFWSAPPNVLYAAATPGTASLRMIPSEPSTIDIHVSADCTDGQADGTYIQAFDATGVEETTAEIPYTLLPGNGQNGSIGAYLGVTLTSIEEAGTTSEFSDCVRITRPQDVAEATVASGETGTILNDVDIEVNATQNATRNAAPVDGGAAGRSGGTLVASVYREQIVPQPGPFQGSATSASGATVTPNAVSSNRHWTLRASGVEDVTYTVCLETDGVGGIADAAQLLVLHRADPGEPWTPYDSSLDGTRLCASSLTAWGDLGIGGDDLVNPVSDDPSPVAPEALAVLAFPNPASGAMTVEVATPETSTARVSVHDALGREVAVLHHGPLAAGLRAFSLGTAGLPPGLYHVRLRTPYGTAMRRVTVVR
ncbi:MAG: hypothetical protein Rubg2KO_11010 [Rubricoccaceae bacterium]